MEENENVLDLDSVTATGGPKRPAFITVLCILTFVGAGIGLLSSLFSLFTLGQLQSTMDTFDRIGSGFNDSDNDLTDVYKWQKIQVYLSLLGNGMCLAGALLMWKLKKAGFFIYVPGQIIPFFGAVMVFTSMSGMMDSTIGGGFFGMASALGLIFAAIFPLAFIIMYGVNLKHLK